MKSCLQDETNKCANHVENGPVALQPFSFPVRDHLADRDPGGADVERRREKFGTIAGRTAS